MNLSSRQEEILRIVADHPKASISEIKRLLSVSISTPQLNRDIASLVNDKFLVKRGAGRSTVYIVATNYRLFAPIDPEDYFNQDPDRRNALTSFNQEVVEQFQDAVLFTSEERNYLTELKLEYQQNIAGISPTLYQKELERLTIELSWKSSQIEGNTYSLLETEVLFKEQHEAKNKSKEEATMLLNHKSALKYLLDNQTLGNKLSLRVIEEVHSLLIKDLQVSRNLRSRSVGITGTAYKPLDNEFQILEQLKHVCELINMRENGFEKALLAVVLISYIQPYEDGNKRTGRMISNALLIADGACPLSYRSVGSLEYKMAMLLFYEQNNLTTFKKLFFDQVVFSVKNYFR